MPAPSGLKKAKTLIDQMRIQVATPGVRATAETVKHIDGLTEPFSLGIAYTTTLARASEGSVGKR